MCLYECDCGFGSRYGAQEVDIINHVRGRDHSVKIGTGYFWHFANCSDCPHLNSQGKRLECMEDVIHHLLDVHGIEISQFEDSGI